MGSLGRSLLRLVMFPLSLFRLFCWGAVGWLLRLSKRMHIFHLGAPRRCQRDQTSTRQRQQWQQAAPVRAVTSDRREAVFPASRRRQTRAAAQSFFLADVRGKSTHQTASCAKQHAHCIQALRPPDRLVQGSPAAISQILALDLLEINAAKLHR